jgi:hypothetical protein
MDASIVLLLLHVASSVAMFAAWAIELATLLARRQPEPDAIGRLSLMASAGMLLTLLTGLGMMAWHRDVQAWMLVAIGGIILVIALSMVFERRARSLGQGGQAAELRLRRQSIVMRIAIGFAILALMIIKPDIVGGGILLALGATGGLALNALLPGRKA